MRDNEFERIGIVHDTVALMIKQTVWELNEPFVGHEGTGGADVTDEAGQRVGVINAVDGRVFTANGRLRFVGPHKPAFASWTEQSAG